MTENPPRLRTVLGRGLCRRCPACGRGAVFQRWLTMHERCGHCGLQYLRDQGDLWAYVIVVDRVLFILPLIAMLYFRLYNPYSVWFGLFAVTLVGALFGTMPQRNAMCLGVDYYIRRKWGDLADPGDAPKQSP
jgi:uncharacterized protein (DUF983 family)